MIYLDYAANTPVDKEVLDLYYDYSLKYFANPNSVHKLGLECSDIIKRSSENILSLLGLKDYEVVYTSGATESNNMAIKGVSERYKNLGKHIIVSSLEHNSVIASASYMQELGYEVDMLPVTKEGLVDLDSLKELLRDDTILVSVTSVDSELGLVQPINEIGEILLDYPNCVFHTDATQAIGKTDVNFKNVDLITIAPHKFYGINGIGLLLKKKEVSLKPIMSGGRSTTVYRSGTPVLPMIAATSFALEKAIKNLDERLKHVSNLNKKIISHLENNSLIHINNTSNSLPFTINFSIKDLKSKDVFKKLEEKEIYVSTKTSCCPPNSPSKLVYALTQDKNLADSSIRVSLSHLTTESEVDIFLKELDKIIEDSKNGKV